MTDTLSLKDALKNNRLKEFIAHAEAAGVAAANASLFTSAIKKIVKSPKQQDQTSGSPLRDGSSGKKTR